MTANPPGPVRRADHRSRVLRPWRRDHPPKGRVHRLSRQWRQCRRHLAVNAYSGAACNVPSHLIRTRSRRTEGGPVRIPNSPDRGVHPAGRYDGVGCSTDIGSATRLTRSDGTSKEARVAREHFARAFTANSGFGSRTAHRPALPDINSISTSSRARSSTAARSNHDFDLTGERVAPSSAPVPRPSRSSRTWRKMVKLLHVCRRTAPWVLPVSTAMHDRRTA